MTIIQPNKQRSSYRLILGLFFLFLFVGALGAVFLYNNVVDLGNRLAAKEKTLQSLEVSNAELKNKLYALTDARTAKEKLQASSLVLDQHPEFITIEPSPVATNL